MPFAEGYNDYSGYAYTGNDRTGNGGADEDPEYEFKLKKSYEKLDKIPVVTPRSPSVAYKEQSRRLAERRKSKTAGGGLRGTNQVNHNTKSKTMASPKSTNSAMMGSRSNVNTPNVTTGSSLKNNVSKF